MHSPHPECVGYRHRGHVAGRGFKLWRRPRRETGRDVVRQRERNVVVAIENAGQHSGRHHDNSIATCSHTFTLHWNYTAHHRQQAISRVRSPLLNLTNQVS